MPHARFERRIAALLAEADVRVDGERPWDLQVHDPRFHARVLGQGSLGLGESYMDGWWDAASLDGLLYRLPMPLRPRLLPFWTRLPSTPSKSTR